jgi:hypothetical protein
MMVFNPIEALNAAFLQRISEAYRSAYGNLGGREHEYGNIIRAAANLAIETIHRTDAFYHDCEHTMMVTLVGQEIFRGKLLSEGSVSPRDWAHFTIALLCHDIGYVRGILPGDSGDLAVIDTEGNTVRIPPGATDAFLTPYHVERGKMFVRSRFGDHPQLDAELIAHTIENTRFPVPDKSDMAEVVDWAQLVQAADLIGQMADPDYPRKLPCLFYEFEETGANESMGNDSPEALRETYPNFFWNMVRQHIEPGIEYLELTREGRDWLAGLYSHVFYQEHRAAL